MKKTKMSLHACVRAKGQKNILMKNVYKNCRRFLRVGTLNVLLVFSFFKLRVDEGGWIGWVGG
jgi:hypothetical protein